MLNRLKLAFVLFAALWLPCQAMAAAFVCVHQMPHDKAMAVSGMAGQEMADDCPMHHSDPTHDAEPARVTVGCDQCGYCHVATASLLPLVAGASPLVALQQVLVAVAPHHSLSHISAPPWQPPKRTA